MTITHQVRKELQEEGKQQQADMHSVHICIGGNHHVFVTQSIQSILYIQRRLEQVKLLIFVNNLFGQAKGVQGFSPEAEYSLGIYISRFGDGPGSGITLGDEEGRLIFPLILSAVMDPAIAKLLIMQVCLFCTLAGQFLNS